MSMSLIPFGLLALGLWEAWHRQHRARFRPVVPLSFPRHVRPTLPEWAKENTAVFLIRPRGSA